MSTAPSPTPDQLVEEAVRQHRAGQAAAAEQLYRRALRDDPAHGEAHHNLGIILIQQGRTGDAIPHLESALASDKTRELYWLSCGRAMAMAGRTGEARAILLLAGHRGMGSPSVDALLGQMPASIPEQAMDLLHAGDRLAERGDIADAIAAYQLALARDPALADAQYHLGSILAEQGRIAEGFAHLMRRAELTHSPAPTTDVAHRIKHDREQRDHLAAQGVTGDGFHIGDGRRIGGPAVDPARATAALFAAWRADDPQLVVIDDFLTPAALDALRAYCADSTIWKRNYPAGYIGATPADGFACPLLAQIAEETAALYAPILDGHGFRYLGGFKYDSELSTGTNTHADFSAVNLNLYITPDEANLDPESGGMIVWNVEPADEAAMRRYNGDEAAAKAFIAASGAVPTRVTHRANRAILFKSSLLHKTDDCRFAEGYLNKRINVSLLYGEWGAKT